MLAKAVRRLMALVAVALLVTCGATVSIGMGTSAALAAEELVMFEERGCPWCIRWHQEVGPAYPKSEEGQRAPLRTVDITRQRQSGVVLRSPIVATPTFVLADDGREVGRITGYPGADFFWGLLGQMLAARKSDPAPATGGATRAIRFAE